MKENDIVKCVSDFNSQFLNLNAEYVLVDKNSFGNWRVRQENSPFELSTHWYKPTRFAKVVSIVKTTAVSLDKKYKTRGGERVNLFTVNSGDPDYPVVGVIVNVDGSVYNESWTADGKMYKSVEYKDNECDLVEEVDEVKIDLYNNRKAVIHKNGAVTIIKNGFDSVALNKPEFDSIVKARNTLLKS